MIYTQLHNIPYQMSSTQHIVLTVDDNVVYDSTAANPAATAATAAAANPPPPSAKIDVKNLKVVERLIQNTEYYMVTYDVKNPTVLSKPEKVTFVTKKEHDSDPNETTYEYTVVAGNGKEVTYDNYAGPNGRGGTEVTFYEIPAAAGNGGKRRNNRRKSAMRKGGRSRRMRRANNRKSSRRF